MAVMNLAINVPDDAIQQFHSYNESDRRAFLQSMNDFALARLTQTNPDEGESTDADLLADVQAADEEAKRTGTISLEDYAKAVDADSGSGAMERIRARRAAGQTLGWGTV